MHTTTRSSGDAPLAARPEAPAAQPFADTLRSLQAEQRRPALLLAALAALLLAGMATWMARARLPVRVASRTARVESQAAAHPVQATIGGTIARTHLPVGATVQAGEALIQFVDDEPRLALAEADARIAGLETQIERVRDEIETGERALAASREADASRLAQLEAEAVQAAAAHEFAIAKAQQVETLAARGSASRVEQQTAALEVRQTAAATEAARRAVERQRSDRVAAEQDRQAALAALRTQVARLGADAATQRAERDRVALELARHTLVAPCAGRVAAAPELRPGMTLAVGDAVATIVPDAPLRLVAHLAPEDALGRVRVGQTCRVELLGFPWPQRDRLSGRVTHVAGEVVEDRVRVECALDAPPGAAPAWEHGLPARVEVETEFLSPVGLLLRSIGGTPAPPIEAKPAETAAP